MGWVRNGLMVMTAFLLTTQVMLAQNFLGNEPDRDEVRNFINACRETKRMPNWTLSYNEQEHLVLVKSLKRMPMTEADSSSSLVGAGTKDYYTIVLRIEPGLSMEELRKLEEKNAPIRQKMIPLEEKLTKYFNLRKKTDGTFESEREEDKPLVEEYNNLLASLVSVPYYQFGHLTVIFAKDPQLHLVTNDDAIGEIQRAQGAIQSVLRRYPQVSRKPWQ